MNHVFPRLIIIPLVLSGLLINIYFVFFAKDYTFLYYVFWLGGFGIFFTKYRTHIALRLQSWRAHPLVKFLILGYGAVLLEEFIVGLVHAATEGFTIEVLVARVAQFWAFNIFAFTGFIVGWYFLSRKIRYSVTDIFLINGIWGLFVERTLTYLGTNPLGAILLMLPVMSTYNLIMAPALASVVQSEQKSRGILFRYFCTFALFFVLSLVPLIVLGLLRTKFPLAFPSCEYIPCF